MFEQRITPQTALMLACRALGCGLDEVYGKAHTRSPEDYERRVIAIGIVMDLTSENLWKLPPLFGHKTHTTLFHRLKAWRAKPQAERDGWLLAAKGQLVGAA